jgi:cell division protein FtsQ
VRRLHLRAPGRRLALPLVLALVVAGGLGWLVLGSSLLAVDRVVVSGTSRVSEADVLAAAGVAPGTPLARVDVTGVRSRIGALAPVERVQVDRGWPSTLRLKVVERTAVATVLTPSGVRLVDREGVPFATASAPPPGTVRLQVPAVGPRDPSTRASLAVLAELPPGLRGRLAILRAATPTAVTLLLRDGRQVVWGGPGRARDKGVEAEALLRLPGDVYDVTSPDVVVRRQLPTAAPLAPNESAQ